MTIEVSAPGRRWESGVAGLFASFAWGDPFNMPFSERRADPVQVVVGFPDEIDDDDLPIGYERVYGIWIEAFDAAAPIVVLPDKLDETYPWCEEGFAKADGVPQETLAWLLRLWMMRWNIIVKIAGEDVLESGLVPCPESGFDEAIAKAFELRMADSAGDADDGERSAHPSGCNGERKEEESAADATAVPDSDAGSDSDATEAGSDGATDAPGSADDGKAEPLPDLAAIESAMRILTSEGAPKAEETAGRVSGKAAGEAEGLEGERADEAGAVGASLADAAEAAASIPASALKWISMKLDPDVEVTVSDDEEAYALALNVYDEMDELKLPPVRDFNLIAGLDKEVCPPEEMCIAMAVATVASANDDKVSLREIRDCLAAFYTELLRAGAEDPKRPFGSLPLTEVVRGHAFANSSLLDGLAAQVAWRLETPSNDPAAVDAALALGVAMLDSYLPRSQRYDFGSARDYAAAVKEQKARDAAAAWSKRMPQSDAFENTELAFCGLSDDEVLEAVKGYTMDDEEFFIATTRSLLAGVLAHARRVHDEDELFEDEALDACNAEMTALAADAHGDSAPGISHADFLAAASGDAAMAAELEGAWTGTDRNTARLVAVCLTAALREIAGAFLVSMADDADEGELPDYESEPETPSAAPEDSDPDDGSDAASGYPLDDLEDVDIDRLASVDLADLEDIDVDEMDSADVVEADDLWPEDYGLDEPDAGTAETETSAGRDAFEASGPHVEAREGGFEDDSNDGVEENVYGTAATEYATMEVGAENAGAGDEPKEDKALDDGEIFNLFERPATPQTGWMPSGSAARGDDAAATKRTPLQEAVERMERARERDDAENGTE